jgi:hypothetical protein
VVYITPPVTPPVLASRPGLIWVINRWHLQHADRTQTAIMALKLGLLETTL